MSGESKINEIFSRAINKLNVVNVYNCYLISVSGITVFNTFLYSKEYLIKYRENKLKLKESEFINNEWEAVKYGAHHYFFENLVKAFCWPINLSLNFIPWVVLKINSKKPEIKNNEKTEDN